MIEKDESAFSYRHAGTQACSHPPKKKITHPPQDNPLRTQRPGRHYSAEAAEQGWPMR